MGLITSMSLLLEELFDATNFTSSKEYPKDRGDLDDDHQASQVRCEFF